MLQDRNPEYFLTIAKEQNISRAAERLHLSQPYLSQYVIRLEKEFGISLLDREKKPLELTRAGEIYAEYLKNSENQYKKLLLDFARLGTDKEQTLRLALSSWRASSLLPGVLPAFSEEYPHIRLILDEQPTSLIYQLILEQKADLSIMNTDDGLPDALAAEPIFHEKILLVGNRNNPATGKLLAPEIETAGQALAVLKNERVVMLRPDIILAKRVNRYLNEMRAVPDNVTYTTNAVTAINLTIGNYGFCFANETAAQAVPERHNLAFFCIGSAMLEHPLCAVYRKGEPLLPVARAFIETSADFYRRHFRMEAYDRTFKE